ncbi:hypothetical protein LTR53_018621, partial [Teratosphaeriaceae sp. CCFEE 6253]
PADAEAVPHAHLCAERRDRQVPLLVLPRQAEEGQEGERRDCVVEQDPREAPAQGQELRHLAALRLPLRHAQHVQGVPRDDALRRRRQHVPGHGRPPPRPLPERAHPQGRRGDQGRRHPPALHQAAAHQGPQVPAAASRAAEGGKEGVCGEEAEYLLL